mmetsp:Transcript_10961/g.15793  ORF Transcript_10961/g.15793 Transcript_10961/m.15793 type:complete len:209 (-) Transcript_10961:176-802(-)
MPVSTRSAVNKSGNATNNATVSHGNLTENTHDSYSCYSKSDAATQSSGKLVSKTVTPTPSKKTRLSVDNSELLALRSDQIILEGAEEEASENRVYHRSLGVDFEATVKEESHNYVPNYLYKNLQYKRKGESELTHRARKAFNLVEEHYIVPSNLEASRFYGPWSGSCYEERVMAAYELNLLQPKTHPVDLCCVCGEIGHFRKFCPKSF